MLNLIIEILLAKVLKEEEGVREHQTTLNQK
jgi:hypothetical protein